MKVKIEEIDFDDEIYPGQQISHESLCVDYFGRESRKNWNVFGAEGDLFDGEKN